MMPPPTRILPSGLAARIIAFISIALVPIGLIALVQTAQLAKETRLRSQLDLAAVTSAAAAPERLAIVRAGGAASALGAAGAVLRDDLPECSAYMRNFVLNNPLFSFAGFLTPDGFMRCASTPTDIDFSTYPVFDRLMATPQSDIRINPNAPISGEPVLLISEPFFTDGVFGGYVSLSLPSRNLRFDNPAFENSGMIDLLVFSKDGHVLKARHGTTEYEDLLPKGVDLQRFANGRTRTFARVSRDGTERVFNVTPLVDNVVFALSIWPREGRAAQAISINAIVGILPFVMWGASVLVAFLAVNRLVIRPIGLLGRRMRRFARSRRISSVEESEYLSQELRDMEDDFAQMAEAILQDEAYQENALREKSILLKEVHHRVKNNLQLMSSIMNMQIRRAGNDETRDVLRGLQDRVRSLATIYRRLYQTEDIGQVDAARLIGDVINDYLHAHGTALTGKPEVALSSVALYPDQAVPLSLLVSEAIANAAQYVPHPDGRIEVRFGPDGENGAVLEIWNDLPATALKDDADGLGHRLMRAFAMQLDGTLDTGRKQGRYHVLLRFKVTDFKPEIVDY